MGGGEVLKKGSLIKSPPMDSGALKMWRKRWFVLLSSKVLEYYKSEGGEQKGVINLEDCHSVNSNLSHKRYKHVFNIETKDRVFFLVAKSQTQMDTWVEALCKVCGLCSDNSCLPATPPPVYSTSSKTKGPNITQPIYATSTRGTSLTAQVNPLESVYSLAAKADYGTRRAHTLGRESANVSVGATLSDAASPSGWGLGSNRVSAASGGSGGDMAGNRLSETAFFSPRPGDNSEILVEVTGDAHTSGGSSDSSPAHHEVTKTRSATLQTNLQVGNTSSGLEHRSQTNVAMYSTVHKQSPRGAQVLSNGYMTPSAVRQALPSHTSSNNADSCTYMSVIEQHPPTDTPSHTLDQKTAALEEGYGVLHMPPPIDRSKKPPTGNPPPPTIDRALKPGHLRKDPELSDSSEDTPEERHEAPPTIKLPEGVSSVEKTATDENESQFNMTDIPQVTVRTTHYTQVDFNPDTRRPVPLPRKTFSAGGTPNPLAPTPRRVNYIDVDLHATTQLHDKLFRQTTVREAEKMALAEKHYINVDHSGVIDDETDPDYYTHMRDLNFDDADKPDYFTVQMQQEEEQAVDEEGTHAIEQETFDN